MFLGTILQSGSYEHDNLDFSMSCRDFHTSICDIWYQLCVRTGTTSDTQLETIIMTRTISQRQRLLFLSLVLLVNIWTVSPFQYADKSYEQLNSEFLSNSGQYVHIATASQLYDIPPASYVSATPLTCTYIRMILKVYRTSTMASTVLIARLRASTSACKSNDN